MLQVVGPRGMGLQVALEKLGDRFHHSVCWLDRRQSISLLTSIEGTDEEIWPPSPPLRALTVEQRGATTVGLLVGMAGKSHWSLSVEADQQHGLIRFDVACRMTTPPRLLGSRYNLTRMSCARFNGRQLIFPCGEEAANVCLPIDDNDVQLDLDNAQPRLTISPRVNVLSLPATVRWRYELQIQQHVSPLP